MSSTARFLLLPVAATVALAAGCTICPDPYDYSGPVPNGSAPQNDFRARSNGIIPIGLAPRPWPPIVKQDRASEESAAAIAQATPAPEATPIPEVIPEGRLDIAAAFESPAPEPAE
jgi:hypothetical protein